MQKCDIQYLIDHSSHLLAVAVHPTAVVGYKGGPSSKMSSVFTCISESMWVHKRTWRKAAYRTSSVSMRRNYCVPCNWKFVFFCKFGRWQESTRNLWCDWRNSMRHASLSWLFFIAVQSGDHVYWPHAPRNPSHDWREMGTGLCPLGVMLVSCCWRTMF